MRLSTQLDPFRTVAPAVSAAGVYRPVSFWQETVPIVPGPPLEGATECDVAIVGGGYTGLSTADELKRRAPQLDVVLLEHSVVGHGASGRNGGFAMPLVGWDLTYLVHKLGRERARRLAAAMYETITHLRRLVDEQQIACDLEASGYLLLATCRRRQRQLEHEAQLAAELGFDHRWIPRAELDGYIRSAAFLGGVFDPHPLIVNPAKLARGRKQHIEAAGVRIYEQTPLLELTADAPERVSLRTPGGEVRARAVVMATNGYSESLGLWRPHVVPVHTYIVLTEPLSDAQLEAVGWRERRASLETARNLIHYFRLTADQRIAFGGEDANLYWRGRYRDVDASLCARLEARFRQYFPPLADVRFTHRWGGVLGVTFDMLPLCGPLGRENVFFAGAYCGHGVALGNYAGLLLAPQVLARLGLPEGEPIAPVWQELIGRRPPRLPREPLRFAGLQVYRRMLRLADWWAGA